MTTPRIKIAQTTEGLHHFVHHMGQYPASMHFVSTDDAAVLAQASEILDRLARRRETADTSRNTDWAFTSRLEDREIDTVTEATNIADRQLITSWWEDIHNISFLASYMASHDEPAMEIAYMIEKPWKYTDQYEAAQDEAEMRGEQS